MPFPLKILVLLPLLLLAMVPSFLLGAVVQKCAGRPVTFGAIGDWYAARWYRAVPVTLFNVGAFAGIIYLMVRLGI